MKVYGPRRLTRIYAVAFALAAALVFVAPICFADPGLTRFPNTSRSGIVFVARNELWVVPLAGGAAHQLTGDGQPKVAPRYSPDGKWIAYSARHAGNQDVWVMPSSGGVPTRLTWAPNHGQQSDEMVVTWTPDSKFVVFGSERMAFNGDGYRLFKVPVEGGVAQPLPIDYAGLASFDAAGTNLAYVNAAREFDPRKRYRGGQAQDIYLMNLQRRQSTRLTHWAGVDTAPMWLNGLIFFVSDRGSERRLNIWVMDLATRRARQITHYKKFDVDFASLGGHYISYQNAGRLYLLDGSQLVPQPIEVKVDLPSVNVQTSVRSIALEQSILVHDFFGRPEFSLSADGTASVLTSRGRLFEVGPSSCIEIPSPSGGAAGHPAWSPNGENWAAAGLMDTLLRWKIKPEVVYGNEAAFQPGVQG